MAHASFVSLFIGVTVIMCTVPFPSYAQQTQQKSECPTEMAAVTWELPPYVYRRRGNAAITDGVIVDIIVNAMAVCCSRFSPARNQQPLEGSLVSDLKQSIDNLNLPNTSFGFFEVNSNIKVPAAQLLTAYDLDSVTTENVNFTFAIPLSASEAANIGRLRPGSIFVPVIESPGTLLIVKKHDVPIGADMIQIICEGWPLFILILAASATAGIVIWLFDRLQNPNEIPRPFLAGFWEGFWWAFVTMTTVGYGDISPRSILGRLFGMVWIIIGVTILSVFTAMITTALSFNDNRRQQQHVFGQHVFVLNGSEDHKLGISKGANVFLVDTVDDLTSRFGTSKTRGILLDQFTIASSAIDIRQTRILDAYENHVTYGVLLDGLSSDLTSCLFKTILVSQHDILKDVTSRIEPLLFSEKNSMKLFQPKTIAAILMGIGVWCLLFGFFVIWEFAYWRPKHKRRQEEKQRELALAAEERRSSAWCFNYGAIVDDTEKENAVQRSEMLSSVIDDAQLNATSNKTIEELFKRQNTELGVLWKERVEFEGKWSRRLHDTRIRHQREQRRTFGQQSDQSCCQELQNSPTAEQPPLEGVLGRHRHELDKPVILNR